MALHYRYTEEDLTFSQRVASILVADIILQWLMVLTTTTMNVLICTGVVLKNMQCTSIFVKIGINDPQAIISIQLMKLTALYTANMNGGKRLLRKS